MCFVPSDQDVCRCPLVVREHQTSPPPPREGRCVRWSSGVRWSAPPEGPPPPEIHRARFREAASEIVKTPRGESPPLGSSPGEEVLAWPLPDQQLAGAGLREPGAESFEEALPGVRLLGRLSGPFERGARSYTNRVGRKSGCMRLWRRRASPAPLILEEVSGSGGREPGVSELGPGGHPGLEETSGSGRCAGGTGELARAKLWRRHFAISFVTLLAARQH